MEPVGHNDVAEYISEVKFPKSPERNNGKCIRCGQLIGFVVFYQGHPEDSCEEFVALTDDRLSICTEKDGYVDNSEFPTHKITHFAVYDEEGHLCPFDTGLIENDVELYFSGYIKPIYDQDPSTNNGISTRDLGPIRKWWTVGHDGGSKLPIGFTTEYASYYLMDPSPEYAEIFKNVQAKMVYSKTVIEFLIDKYYEHPVYEDLLQVISKYTDGENILLQHAQFICDQVVSYDNACPDFDAALISFPCMKTLMDLTGVKVQKPKRGTKMIQTPKCPKWRKAVTTNLVRHIFDNFFLCQIDRGEPEISTTQKGNNKRLTNDTESDVEEGDERKIHKKRIYSENLIENGNSSLSQDEIEYKPGDFVVLKSESPTQLPFIAKIVYITNLQKNIYHFQFFCHGSDTILGEASKRGELFLVDECKNLPFGVIEGKAEVEFIKEPDNWSELGGQISYPYKRNRKAFFYSKRWDEHRFVDIEKEIVEECGSCRRISQLEKYEEPLFEENSIKWKNETYKVGSGVFLSPAAYSFETNVTPEQTEKNIDKDPVKYPEFYRKSSDNVKGSNNETPQPFVVALIENIKNQSNGIKVTAKIFYRPENTINTVSLSYTQDINRVYYTVHAIKVPFDLVKGKCYLATGLPLEALREWSKKGPYRFYFTTSYHPALNYFDQVPLQARNLGCLAKAKGAVGKKSREVPPDWVKPDRPLLCLDVFAGCGGLSEGLHEAGISSTKWAIEKDVATADAFRLNNPDCNVITADCNDILKTILSGQGEKRGLPKRGEVELLIGGPPCQGFSSMNRFNSRQYSIFKNSLIVSYLSYCDYYRPKYFILENVRNFAAYKRGMVLKLTLRCLLAIGYQVTFGILQAGQYGIPQSRRRLIVMAAAPGYVLPKYPEPQNVFSGMGNKLLFTIDDWTYDNGCDWSDSAPYRSICVRDAIDDLPQITNGCGRIDVAYKQEASSYFQKIVRRRNDNAIITDHICKKVSPMGQARITRIPNYPGADWRDLPNISVVLEGCVKTNILRYSYRLDNQEDDEPPHGVCKCATGAACDPADKQKNTLIPWCLSHTADRNNNWSGLYGRLEWDGFFSTTVTNPEPMAKQGRVLHPEQNRVVSVRECARSQGFRDSFQFSGNILDKYRVNYLLFGLQPMWFHMVNVLLHAIACFLFTNMCLRVTNLKPPFAAVAGLLFAVHPVHTEATS